MQKKRDNARFFRYVGLKHTCMQSQEGDNARIAIMHDTVGLKRMQSQGGNARIAIMHVSFGHKRMQSQAGDNARIAIMQVKKCFYVTHKG